MIGAVAVALVAAGIAFVVYRLPRPAPATPTSFSATGDLTLTPTNLDAALSIHMGAPCAGRGGYDDIRAGTDVVVYGPQDETVGLGRLSPGTGSGSTDHPTCVFTFTVPNVPVGKQFYSIEVAHRGKLHYTEAQLHADLHLTLGG